MNELGKTLRLQLKSRNPVLMCICMRALLLIHVAGCGAKELRSFSPGCYAGKHGYIICNVTAQERQRDSNQQPSVLKSDSRGLRRHLDRLSVRIPPTTGLHV